LKKKRLIPVLLLKDGWLVQSKGFGKYQNLGNPTFSVKRLSEWAADELIYLDISKSDNYDLRRDDLRDGNKADVLSIIEDVSKVSFMPITIGGKIRTLDDIAIRLSKGADKVSINTQALNDPSFITAAAKEFGSQCIVVCCDVKLTPEGYRIYRNGGTEDAGHDMEEWVKTCENAGAGELLIQSIDRDGSKKGYDIEMLNRVCDRVKIPVIALGGVGNWDHFEEAITQTNVDAVAAANIFQYMDQSVYIAKKHLYENKLNFRKPFIIKLS
jgi:imidazole glycerol-phosphate synthase subunit HisF